MSWILCPGLCAGIVMVLACSANAAATPPEYAGPSNADLDAAREWLWAHPPDGTNTAQRLEKMAVIQAAADQCSGKDARRYSVYWVFNPDGADAMEQFGIAYYVRQAADRALDQIRRTTVSHGAVLWLLYNMGYVVKTPDACFGIDICLRDGARLVKDLDFLLISHNHGDHYAGGLAQAMIRAGKPVITNFLKDSTIVKEPREFQFGAVRVKIDIGSHSQHDPDLTRPMLMFQADCGPASGDFTVYHSGDGADYSKMTPDRPVDVFIPHVACNDMSVADAARHVGPKVTLVSHVLELTHEVQGARWSYAYAINAVKDLPEGAALVLTWGERWSPPGTTTKP